MGVTEGKKNRLLGSPCHADTNVRPERAQNTALELAHSLAGNTLAIDSNHDVALCEDAALHRGSGARHLPHHCSVGAWIQGEADPEEWASEAEERAPRENDVLQAPESLDGQYDRRAILARDEGCRMVHAQPLELHTVDGPHNIPDLQYQRVSERSPITRNVLYLLIQQCSPTTSNPHPTAAAAAAAWRRYRKEAPRQHRGESYMDFS
jgi:hypothetical protein